MEVFNQNNFEELKEFIYNSYAHDSKIEDILYEYQKKELTIKAFNSFYNVKIYLHFCGVEFFMDIKKNDIGSSDTIASLTAENDFSYLKNYLQYLTDDMKNCLYILFQMFSGDELHIVTREVIVNISK